MATSKYDIGDLVRCRAAFTTTAGVAADPTTVTFTIKSPDNTTTVYVSGVDAELVNSGVGVYYVDWSPGVSGTWWYEFKGVGALQALAEGIFFVMESRV